MPTVTTQIEIAAPPSTVRAKFLNFDQIPIYSPNGFIHSINSTTNKAPTELAPGDKLDVVVGAGKTKFSPVMVENSAHAFRWLGSLPGIFSGEHRFIFSDSKKQAHGNIVDSNSTTFIHEESFSGALGWMMGNNWLATKLGQTEKTKRGFEGFNRDFKAWVEGK